MFYGHHCENPNYLLLMSLVVEVMIIIAIIVDIIIINNPLQLRIIMIIMII